MDLLLRKLPKWFIVIIVIYLMALFGYSVFRGAAVKFWPPEIIPSTTSLDLGKTVDLSKTRSVVFQGELSSKGKVRAHQFAVNQGSLIFIQPKTTTNDSLYFDLTVQSPSGKLATVERYKSLDRASRFPYTASESGDHLLLVSKRTDNANLDGPYLMELSVQGQPNP